MTDRPKYPGIRIVANGNQLVAYHTEARLADAGIFYPITPSTEMGELFQLSYAEGNLNVFGRSTIAIETEGEHAAQGGAIAHSVTGKRVVNFTSGQGLAYGMEQYYHAPGKLATMVVEVSSRALTKHALNVHCGHDDIYSTLDTGWLITLGRDAQQAADQALIMRRVTELSLTPGINAQDGFLTSHLERTFYKHEAGLIREFLGSPDDLIDSPTPAQRELFGPKRRRVPEGVDLKNPMVLGPVQNQPHYMNGVIARRNHFYEPILGMFEEAYAEFGRLTGRHYGLISEYNTDGADTVFVSLGSAAENIEAAVDHLKATRGETVGSIHINVLRPFPEAAVVKALAGCKNVIVLERTDEPLAGANPLTRDIRVALSKAVELGQSGVEGGIREDQKPRIFSGAYGLGSRDFRPEGILGAYEFATGKIARRDGRKASDGESFFVVGIEHPYDVCGDETPSLLPGNAIAVRMHSIGGWGMITTGKNLGAIIGEFGEHLSELKGDRDEFGRLKEVVHVSANPRYGSEKKGAPTAYFLVAAPERIRVNCDLRHVNVVLCCDPKAFTHMNPMVGMAEGGAFVWESRETPEKAWTRVPRRLRKEIIDKKIRLFILPGFEIARKATERVDLQLRMQGNAFLGAFFGVSPFLADNNITREHFEKVVLKQYQKKFGRFGEAVVQDNMEVMSAGFDRVVSVPYGDVDAPDNSDMRGDPLLPRADANGCGDSGGGCKPQPERPNLFKTSYFDAEFRSGLGYDQPASPLSAVGVVAAATGATVSKYVARRETPVFTPENCTQCMECISACPDTALPNMAHDVSTILSTAINSYVSDETQRTTLEAAIPQIDAQAREAMQAAIKSKEKVAFKVFVGRIVDDLADVSTEAKQELKGILDILPLAYSKANAIFRSVEKKNPGEGGLFSIFVSDLCKGCGECVLECGHDALHMLQDSEELNTQVAAATAFMDLLPDTEQKYLGKYDSVTPNKSRPAALRNHLMVKRNYQALVSGDGACAGCGEKSALRSIATITEAVMRPIYHQHADRVEGKASALDAEGAARLAALRERSPAEYALFTKAVAHVVMGLGGESDGDTEARLAAHGEISDAEIVGALTAVMRRDAFHHKDFVAVEGRLDNGMSVMAMGASTGCNSVYGSTPPNNPHPYPWMNSLFQDGATISWLMSESFIVNHVRRSVVPERLSDALLERDSEVMSETDYFDLTHFGDALMTDREISELPKVWCIGGDGALGDIGFQNLSKVILQNRPNVKVLMLDTQVYSNTGGQNSDSSPMPGGFDMNSLGAATQGKLTEKKSVAEIMTSGHGSPYVAQISMADQPGFYKAILDALDYRGTAFFQCFTTCQPEHGVGDDMSTVQATRIRDSRGMPQFVFNPEKGESYDEAMDIKSNPNFDRDWKRVLAKVDRRPYAYTIAHWAVTEARFRRHSKPATADAVKDLVRLDNLLLCIRQDDVVKRRHQRKGERAFVPDFGSYIEIEEGEGVGYRILSRQMVLFCVERRKAWRMLQSKAGVVNKDYLASRKLLAKVDAGELTRDDVLQRGQELLEAERAAL